MTLDTDNIFVVVSEPRTGSTVLTHKLELLNGVSCQGEIFHPDEIFSSVSSNSIPDIDERNKNPVDFLQKIIAQTYEQRGQSDIIGFKLFFDHNQTMMDYILKSKISVVLLERKNKLAQYSSLKIAKKTGLWNSGDIISKEQQLLNEKRGKKVLFSLVEFIAYSIRSRYRFKNLVKNIKKSETPYYYMAYENMFNSEEWANMIDFLNIKTADINVNPTYKKQNKGSLFDRFSNPGYAYYCCKLLLYIPYLSTILSITPDMFKK